MLCLKLLWCWASPVRRSAYLAYDTVELFSFSWPFSNYFFLNKPMSSYTILTNKFERHRNSDNFVKYLSGVSSSLFRFFWASLFEFWSFFVHNGANKFYQTSSISCFFDSNFEWRDRNSVQDFSNALRTQLFTFLKIRGKDFIMEVQIFPSNGLRRKSCKLCSSLKLQKEAGTSCLFCAGRPGLCLHHRKSLKYCIHWPLLSSLWA